MKPKPTPPFAKAPKRGLRPNWEARFHWAADGLLKAEEKLAAAEADKRILQQDNEKLRATLGEKVRQAVDSGYDKGFKDAVNCKCSVCLARKAELRYAAVTLNEMQYSESKDSK